MSHLIWDCFLNGAFLLQFSNLMVFKALVMRGAKLLTCSHTFIHWWLFRIIGVQCCVQGHFSSFTVTGGVWFRMNNLLVMGQLLYLTSHSDPPLLWLNSFILTTGEPSVVKIIQVIFTSNIRPGQKVRCDSFILLATIFFKTKLNFIRSSWPWLNV